MKHFLFKIAFTGLHFLFSITILGYSAHAAKSVVGLSARTCQEGATVEITCSFAGLPPFGATSVPTPVRFHSSIPFTATAESDLADFDQSPTSQPKQIVDQNQWLLAQPWASFPNRYSSHIQHNDTSVTFRIISAIAEDTGYYGCIYDSAYSIFKPLLVYANDIRLNASVLIGSQSNLSKIGDEIELTYNGVNSQYVELAVKLISPYANLPFTASLFINRSINIYPVVSPNADVIACDRDVFCLWNVQLIVQVVLSDASSLHADRLSLAFAHPSNRSRTLWSASARLLDDRQQRGIVTNASVVCSGPARTRVRHGQPASVACSVPRLWLSLPGFQASWTIDSPVQFYPVGKVACAYAAGSLASNRFDRPPVMLDPSDQPGACIGNRFLDSLDAEFSWRPAQLTRSGLGLNPGAVVDNAAADRIEFVYSLPKAYYVHSDRAATFRISVGEQAFAKQPLPMRTFAFDVEDAVTSAGVTSRLPSSVLLAMSAAATAATAVFARNYLG